MGRAALFRFKSESSALYIFITMTSAENERNLKIIHEFFDTNKPYSIIDAIKVNKFLGIDPATGILPESPSPARINIDYFTPEILKHIKEHPLDTELFIGWDLVNGRPQITEVTEGLTPAEVEKRNEEYAKEDNPILKRKLVGSVRPQGRHLIEFHTHPRAIYTDDEWELVDKIRQATPATYWADFFNFLKCPSTYASFVLDTSEWNGAMVGRVLFAMKTENSMKINEENSLLNILILTHEIQFNEFLDNHPHKYAKQMLFGDNQMVNRLQQDEHWAATTGICLYRGKVWENSKSVKLLRWDKYYDRLMKLRKKWLRFI